ncbi:MAG: SBBP repeat-containing protein, partial [Candidatus Acidiferrales bacterium]
AGADCDGIAVDASGNAYVVGATPSTDFPVVDGYQSTGNANYVAFVSKFDPTGATLLYSTYLGGTGGDYGYGIALDPTGNVYVTGYSFSTDFPIVNGFQTANNNPTYGNAFIARLDTTQTGAASLLYSSYVGGGGNSTNSTQGYGDLGFGIAADAYGFTYVTGVTTSDTSVTPFPTTPTAYQSSLASPNGNAFLTVVNTNQSGSASLFYSTYLGGDGAGVLIGDIGDSVAVDGSGDAYIVGQTTSDSSAPFPTTSNAYQSSLKSPDGNAFVAEISTYQSGAQSLVYSSYFGGSTTSIVGDWGENIALDGTDKAYITGGADSFDFPITAGAFQSTNSDGGKAFAAKFDLTQSGKQSLVYSTFLGGTNGSTGENGNGIVVDSNGDAYVVGCTSSSDFPTTSDAFQSTLKSSGVNAYLSELNPGGTALQYSTYLGGSSAFGDVATSVALDSLTNPYVAGYTDSSDFPTLNAFQSSLNGGQSGFVTKFALVANPEITASPSPGPNAAGWNNSAVTVTFACVPGAAPIQSCTSPTIVSTEGANQVVSGTAADTANNTATASDTVNLDLTPPVLTIASPANNATVSTPYVIISGTLTDSLSGPGNVNCGGAPAAVTGTNFSCTVQLSSVSNSITVTGYDLAGNSSTATLSVTVSMSAPTSLTVSPANPNMLVGGTQAFTAVDQTGTRRLDVTWSASDSTIASFVSGSPDTLVGNAAGTVTLTATVGSVIGQTTVTVLSGLSTGTILWSAPGDGSGVTQYAFAVPSPTTVADVFMFQASGAAQALNSDGTVVWTSNALANSYSIIPDAAGGVMGLGSTGLTRLDPATGQQSWQYSPSGSTISSSVAVHPNGTIFLLQSSSIDPLLSVVAVDGATGDVKFSVPIEDSTFTGTGFCDEGGPYSNESAVAPTQPIVGGDGNVYLAYYLEVYDEDENLQTCDQVNTTQTYLKLLRVTPGGQSTVAVLHSWAGTSSITYDTNGLGGFTTQQSASTFPTPGLLIGSDQNGLELSWSAYMPSYYANCVYVPGSGGGTTCTPQVPASTENMITSIESMGTSSEFEMPNNDVTSSMLVGQNNTLFINGSNALYSLTQGGGLEWSASATYAGQLANNAGGIVTSPNDGSGNLVTFDLTGSSTIQPLGVTYPSQSWHGDWYGLTSSGMLQQVFAEPVFAANTWAQFGGDPSGVAYAARPWVFILNWQNAFDFIPAWPEYLQNLKTDITYDATTIKGAALTAFKKAYKAWPVTIVEGTPGTGDHQAVVYTSIPSSDCGDTNLNNQAVPKDSAISWECVMEQAQIALQVNINNAQDESNALMRQDLIQAMGRGIGNTAAHEVAHQFLGLCCSMDVFTSADPQAAATYNNGDGDGNPDPSIPNSDPAPYTGYGKDGKTAIHWEDSTDKALTACLGPGWTPYLGLCTAHQ